MVDVVNEGGKKLRWSRMYPELGTGPVDAESCTSPEYFELEKEKIFKKVWWKVARAEELPRPGDYKVKRFHFADTSVIIIRGRDNKFRAFYNTCSHRGNTVISETAKDEFFRELTGHARGNAVTCRFHGWVYSSDGSLMFVPEEEYFPCFEKEKNGLTPVACDEWEGFVFINLDPKPRWPLAEFLGGFGHHYAGFPYEELTTSFHYWTVLNSNWKVCLDAFSEAYHVHTIHAGSFPGIFTSEIENVKIFGPHRTCCVCFATPPEMQPTAAIAQKIAQYSGLYRRQKTMLPPTVNPNKLENFSFEMGVIFPSLLLHLMEGSWFTHHFIPIAVDKTLWEGDLYIRSPQTNAERWSLEQWQVIQRNAWLEDTQTMEDTYRSLKSGGKKKINLHDHEVLIRHSYKAVDDWVHDRQHSVAAE